MPYLQSPDGFVFTSDTPAWHPECKVLTNAAGKAAARERALSELRAIDSPL